MQLRRQRTRFCWHHKCATSWQYLFATHAQANTAELRTTPTSGVQVANRSEAVASREVAAEHLPLLSAATVRIRCSGKRLTMGCRASTTIANVAAGNRLGASC